MQKENPTRGARALQQQQRAPHSQRGPQGKGKETETQIKSSRERDKAMRHPSVALHQSTGARRERKEGQGTRNEGRSHAHIGPLGLGTLGQGRADHIASRGRARISRQSSSPRPRRRGVRGGRPGRSPQAWRRGPGTAAPGQGRRRRGRRLPGARSGARRPAGG